ncbi:MAG TPA: DNA phosphorothioation-associated protein 4 [Polyangiaceae bacterium]|jgi:dnd system-associated protein 4
MDRAERRPAPPKVLEGVLDKLYEMGIFVPKQKGLMFAAALGYSRGDRVPLEVRGNGIRYEIFQSDGDDAFISALAVAVTKDLRVLSAERNDERITIFEEYAHGGLIHMQRVCFEQEGDPLDNLLRLTIDARSSASAEIPGIDRSVLAGLI